VMFPAGMHQYTQRMVAPPHVASMPRMPFMAPPAVPSPPVADPYARYLAVDHLQAPPPPPPPPMVPPPLRR
jgi:phytochrome-interacting factor 4